MAEPVERAAIHDVLDRPAVWEDFVDIFYAPSDVFARRQTGSFWSPLFVVTILTGTVYLLTSGAMQPIFDGEFNRQIAAAMRKNPQINADAMNRFREIASRIAQVAAFISMPIVITMIGTTLWLVGKLFEARQTFKAALIVAAYSCVPKIIEAVLNGLQALLLDPAQLNGPFRVSLGLGRFFDPDLVSPLLLAIVGRVNVFTIWVTILLAIGLAVTGKISRPRAFMAAVVVWILGALPMMFQAIRNM
jgi:Yip1-like protein